ncbi:hypothetical protein MMC07_008638 [Pseudocyphellaria aurata]|nr:hypothetical protein [Pseudocyphellaria aurata]
MEELAIMDQMPFMNFYSQIVLCFPLAGSADNSEIIADLEKAMRTITRIFPFLNKQVVLERDEGSVVPTSGTHKLAPRDNADELLLRVNRIAGHFPSYEEIRRSRAPVSLLDGSVLAPMKSLPDMCDFSTPQPVLVVQANFIAGGLLLCFAVMHNALDGHGLGQVIKHFATACRGGNISDADIKAGNLARSNLFPPLRPGEPSQTHSMYQKQRDQSTTEPNDSQSIAWVYYGLSAVKLAELKREASRKASTISGASWLSTNDALSALIWRAIVTARLPKLKLDRTSSLERAVNGRKFVRPAVPDSYMGACVVDTFSTLSVSDLVQKLHISDIALVLRKSLNEVDDYRLRSHVSLLYSEPDKRNITFSLPSPDTDVLVSSWAAWPVYPSDFGEHLGKPEFVRRPNFGPLDGLAYMMPRNLAGDIDVAICLKTDDLERLKDDSVWRTYADYIG